MTTFRAHSDSRILKPFDAQIPTFYTLDAKKSRSFNLGEFSKLIAQTMIYI